MIYPFIIAGYSFYTGCDWFFIMDDISGDLSRTYSKSIGQKIRKHLRGLEAPDVDCNKFKILYPRFQKY